MTERRVRIGIDTGGTFPDVVGGDGGTGAAGSGRPPPLWAPAPSQWAVFGPAPDGGRRFLCTNHADHDGHRT